MIFVPFYISNLLFRVCYCGSECVLKTISGEFLKAIFGWFLFKNLDWKVCWMMAEIEVRISYSGETRIRLFSLDMSFCQFKLSLGEIYVGVDMGCMKFVCQVGSLSEIVVEGDSDFRNLIRLCAVVSAKNIKVDVVPNDLLGVDVEGDRLGIGLLCNGSLVVDGISDSCKVPLLLSIVGTNGHGVVDLGPELCLGSSHFVVCSHSRTIDVDVGEEIGGADSISDGVFQPEVEVDYNLSCSLSNCEGNIVLQNQFVDVLDVGLEVMGVNVVGGVDNDLRICDYNLDRQLNVNCVDVLDVGLEVMGVNVGGGLDNELQICDYNVDDQLNVNCDGHHPGKNYWQKSKEVVDVSAPSYDICPSHKKRPLLSDEWDDIFKAGLDCKWLGGAVHFRTELIKYSTHMGFKFRYVRNDRRYVHVVCQEYGESGCNWFIKARKHIALPRFEVHKANFVHKCIGKIIQNNGERMSPPLIGEMVLDKVKQKPEISGKDIMKMFLVDYGIELPYWKAWRTADAARARIFGSFNDSYDQLRWYCQALMNTNPGSVVSLEISSRTNQFERVFVTVDACVRGFQFCRPMIFIDATFMKGRAIGTLLIATAKDGDNGLFPVAFAVVSAENTSNWEWFLCKIRDCVKHEQKIFFMSDRNIGLLAAIAKVFVNHVNFFCMFHLLANLKLRFPKGWTNAHREKMADCFKACAYGPTVSIFEEKMAIFKMEGGTRAETWINDLPVEKWAVCYSPIMTRYGEMTSNAAESFNSWISKEREMPITYMIDLIRVGINKWHVDRRKDSNLWNGAIVPSKEFLWSNLSNIGRTWFVLEASSGAYEVRSTPSATVVLDNRTCSCMQWQISGFPCAHAVTVIKRVSDSVIKYVDPFFYAQTYRECYRFNINPIPETEKFQKLIDVVPSSKIMPPVLKRAPGRPRKERMTVFGKVKKLRKSLCERCGKYAKHDIWKCNGDL